MTISITPTTEKQLEEQDQGSIDLPAKRPLTPEIIARLGPNRRGIVAGFGIFKGTGVFPEDSLEYQLEVRAEWD